MTHPDYAPHRNHPLHRVPTEAIEAARAAMADIALYEKIPGDSDEINSIADALVMSLVPWIKEEPKKPCPTCKGKGVVGGNTGFSYDYPWTCDTCKGTGEEP